ncbi:MAG: GGDEF and EAL domain-containing protein [Candidatus Izemoplasmatales bacterium]
MINPLILEIYLSQGFEVVVAVVIILVTAFAAFMLYRSVRADFRQEIENRKLMKEALAEAKGGDDKDKLFADKKAISKKSKDIYALVDQELARAKEGEVSVLFYMNIDDFRRVVKDYGQDKADKVVDEIAGRLRKLGDKRSVAGHKEHDVFLYYLPGPVDNDVIKQYAGMILKTVAEPLKAVDGAITTSIGVVVFPFDGISVAQLVKNAEIALYVAKKKGKNQFALYSSELIEKEQFNANYYHEIKESIKNDEFLLYYQPIVDVKTGRLIGLESLLRWNHPTLGILPPGKFLNVMELTGDITWFGAWGFEKIVEQYVAWKKSLRIKDIFISTNLSPKQLELENLARTFYEIVKKQHFEPEAFCLEIIDYYTVVKNPVCVQNLNEFRRFGFRIAIDDLGDQFELIQDMTRIPANIVKIAREDVLKIMNKFEEAEKIERVIAAALSRQKVVIAEGVEDTAMLADLAGLGVRFMQGYYFSPPKSIEETAQILKKTPWSVAEFGIQTR